MVIGGGVTGLMIAERLAATGRDVCVVEARRVAAGVTGSSTAKVTSLHGATYHRLARRGPGHATAYAQAAQAGLDAFRRLVETHDIDCGWARMDAVTYTADPQQTRTIRAEAEAAAAAGLAVIDGTNLAVPFPVAAAVRCPDQAMLDPVRFCRGLAEVLRRQGVQILEGARVRHVQTGPPHVATTDDTTISAPVMVLATQLPIYDPGLFFARCEPVRSYVIAATLDQPAPEVMSISIDDPARSMRPIEPGGSRVLLGGPSHRVGEGGDTRRFVAELEQWARDTFEVRSVDARWSAQDMVPADEVPFIGRMPRAAEGVLVATGFKKWGFTSAAVAGILLSDLLEGRDNPWAETFDSTRLAVDPAAAGELVRSNAAVAVHFIGDRISSLAPADAATLAPGEAGIVQHAGEKVAGFRDDEGELHLLSARCPHMGCLVAWNPAERSWDCPCHGSRFGTDGEVITGPATIPLPVRSRGFRD